MPDVGIRLVREVCDHYRGPDHKFRWLISFAENANDRTRTGWPNRTLLARRIEKSPARASNIATELVADGVLKRDGGGGRNRGSARYVLLPLSAQSSPSTNPERTCQGSRKTNPDNQPQGSPQRDQGSQLTNPVSDHGLLTTNPHIPSTPPGGAASAPNAQAILKSFIDWDRANGGQLTRQTIGQLAKHIKRLLDEGIDDKYIRSGLAEWRAKEMHPAALDSFVNAAMNGHAPKRHRRRESTGDRAIAEAAALKAQLLDRKELA